MTVTWGDRAYSCRLRREVCQKKVGYIMEAFQSQRTKRWFQQETFLSLMRLTGHGMQCSQRLRRSVLLPQASALR